MIFTLLIAAAMAATYGLDISTLHTVSQMQCFVSNGFTFIIPRCYCSVGCMDDNCAQNVLNAKSGGMSRVDAYFFPCYSCGNVAGQVTSYWSSMTSQGIDVTRTWFDIEGEWSSSYTTNQAFLMEMINQARYIGIVHGIYCNQYHWNLFFSLDYIFPYHSETQIWYAHWNYQANYDYFDVMQFGGWTTPDMKQYQDTTIFCGGSVDFNYQE